jgi:hypothetical protein
MPGLFHARHVVAVCHSLTCVFTANDRLTMSAAAHVPNPIWRLGKSIFSGHGRIAEYLGVVARIDAGQATRFYVPALIFEVEAALLRPSRGTRSERSQAGGYRKRDEMLFSAHGNPPFVSTL